MSALGRSCSVLTFVGALLLASNLAAQAVQKLRVEVTAVTGGNVYLDKGREAKILPGDSIVLHPTGAPAVQGVVRAISKHSARAEIIGKATGIQAGCEGEVLVPVSRFEGKAEPSKDAAKKPLPKHKPWENEVRGDSQLHPLLAPAQRKPREEREVTLRGRVYVNGIETWSKGTVKNNYFLGRSGAEVVVTNPLKQGGSFQFRGDLTHRRTQLADSPDLAESRARIDRLSYRHGDERTSPFEYEIGRFLQPLFPELGVLDGASGIYRTTDFGRSGVSIGGMPQPFPAAATTDDVQIALFHRQADGPDERLVYGGAIQKTWHKGKADRDLLLGSLDYRPVDELSMNAALWIDYYGGGDTIKQKGFQVTELRLQGTYYAEGGHGIGATITQLRWPELRRNEFRALDAAKIRDNRITRLGTRAWYRATDKLRLDARGSVWQDQSTSGSNAEIGGSLRDSLYERGQVRLSLFINDGSVVTGHGIRIGASRSFDSFFLDLAYEWSRYEYDALGLGASSSNQQAFTAIANIMAGAKTDISVNFDLRNGGGQDSISLGVFFQRRF